MVGDVTQHSYIRNSGIRGLVSLAVLYGDRNTHPVIIQDFDSAGLTGRGIILQIGEFRFLLVFIQVRNIVVGRYTGTSETNLAPVFPDQDIVQLQVRIGKVVDLNLRLPVGLQPAPAVQGIRPDVDVAAADGNIRNLHIADGKAFGNINLYRFAFIVFLFLEQAALVHLIQDPLALLHIP